MYTKLKPKSAPRTTNVECVTEAMEFSAHGALIQAFVMAALEKYSLQVKAAGPACFDNPMISGAAWVGCAEEILTKLDNHYSK